MKILNLYAGIGGNRKLWGDEHQITTVELDPDIAKIYKDFFPNDEVIIADAHQYLLEHFKEFDFIWSSPPCPTHSRFNLLNNQREGKSVKYPDMKLYEEIIYLRHWYKGKYCVENVISYYKPLIEPQEINNHYFWTNFYIRPIEKKKRGIRNGKNHIQERSQQVGFDVSKYKVNSELKRKILNNCVEPETGLHVFNEAFKSDVQPLF
jgi:DNA (cytosine-5)-methyltransferase 1